MLFNSYVFLFAFLPLVLVGTWALRSKNPRLLFLTLASWVFYAWWNWKFLPLMLSTTMVDYVAALAIHRADVPRPRKVWLTGSRWVNRGPLRFFKYGRFVLKFFKYFRFIVRPLKRIGKALGADDVARRRNAWLIGSLSVNLGLLGYFKYAGFFFNSFNGIAKWIGVPGALPVLSI